MLVNPLELNMGYSQAQMLKQTLKSQKERISCVGWFEWDLSQLKSKGVQ